MLQHLGGGGGMNNTVLLTRDEALVPRHLGETDKDCFTPDQGRGSVRAATPDKIDENVPPFGE